MGKLVILVVLLRTAALASQVPVPAPKLTHGHRDPLLVAPTRLDRMGRILVPVIIDGKGPFRFLLDTGADGSVISAHLAQKLGLVSPRNADERVEGTTGFQRLPWVSISELRIGEIVKTNLRMPVVNSPVLTGLDGILGMAGFGRVRVAVDFRHDKVAVGPSRASAMWGYLDIQAERTGSGLLMIPARVGGVEVEAVIDTGAEETLGNSALKAALLARAAEKAAQTKVYGVTKQVSVGGVVKSPTIYLGSAAIRNLNIVYSDIPIFKTWHLDLRPALIIGMNVLGTVDALVLDYPRAKVYLLPHESPGDTVRETDVFFPWLGGN